MEEEFIECVHCKRTFRQKSILSHLSKSKKIINGKTCREGYSEELYEELKAKSDQNTRKRRVANNLELGSQPEKKAKIAEMNKRYYDANKEKIVESKKRFYNSNKVKISESKKRYNDSNKDKIADSQKLYYRQTSIKSPYCVRQKLLLNHGSALIEDF